MSKQQAMNLAVMDRGRDETDDVNARRLPLMNRHFAASVVAKRNHRYALVINEMVIIIFLMNISLHSSFLNCNVLCRFSFHKFTISLP